MEHRPVVRCPAEIAAWIILIRTCSGGVDSNAMPLLAKGSVPLSVSMTACFILMVTFMTPLAMRGLAGRFIEIDFLTMMQAIVGPVILPVGAGLLLNRLLARRGSGLDRMLPGIRWQRSAPSWRSSQLGHEKNCCVAGRCCLQPRCSTTLRATSWATLRPVAQVGRDGPRNRGFRSPHARGGMAVGWLRLF